MRDFLKHLYEFCSAFAYWLFMIFLFIFIVVGGEISIHIKWAEFIEALKRIL